MAVKLHRCPFTILKAEGHGCYQVQKALEDQGIEYEVVKAPLLRPRRKDVIALTGQEMVPTIEFEDGTAYRAESKEMVARIRAGELGTTAAPAAPAAPG